MRVHGRYSKGAIELLDKIDLVDGQDVVLDVFRGGKTLAEQLAIVRETAGAWEGLIDAEKLKEDIYADRLIQTRREVKL